MSSNKDSWTQDEIDAHEARGGAWGGGGRPVPGIDYATVPDFMRPLKASRDWSKYTPPEDSEDD